MNKKLLVAGLTGALAIVGAVALAPDVYVSPTGNDANQCTITQPCKTITRGIAKATAGQTVLVQAGTYKENIQITKPINLVGDGAIIDGTGLPIQNGGGVVNIPASVSGATVQGFEIQNGVYYGLSVFGSNNKILNNKIHNIQKVGIWIRDGKFNLFEGNELYYSVLVNSVSFNGTYYTCNPNNTTGWESAVNPWGSASNNIFRNNSVHDNCGEGLVLYNGDIAEGNTVKDNWSVEIYIDGHTDVTVRNNTVTNTRPYVARGSNNAWKTISYGIAIADESGCLADRNTITGNTVTGARYGFSFYAYSTCSGLKNTVIENNQFLNSWEYGMRITTGAHSNVVVRNNVVSSPYGSAYNVPASIVIDGAITPSTPTRTTMPPTQTASVTPKTATPTLTPTLTVTPVFDPRCDPEYLPAICIYKP